MLHYIQNHIDSKLLCLGDFGHLTVLAEQTPSASQSSMRLKCRCENFWSKVSKMSEVPNNCCLFPNSQFTGHHHYHPNNNNANNNNNKKCSNIRNLTQKITKTYQSQNLSNKCMSFLLLRVPPQKKKISNPSWSSARGFGVTRPVPIWISTSLTLGGGSKEGNVEMLDENVHGLHEWMMYKFILYIYVIYNIHTLCYSQFYIFKLLNQLTIILYISLTFCRCLLCFVFFFFGILFCCGLLSNLLLAMNRQRNQSARLGPPHAITVHLRNEATEPHGGRWWDFERWKNVKFRW